jgi:acetyltransferase-like isoleucine patch superfamily enzyme
MNNFFRLIRYDWPLHLVLFLTNWLPDNVIFLRLRGSLARPFFKQCGKKLGIGRNVTFYNPSNISIGDWVYIAYGNWFSAANGIQIGDEVLFGPYNVIASSNHTRLNNSYRFGVPEGGKIVIGKGTWVGAHCTILQSSSIGEGSIIAANSVVNSDVPSNCLFAGNPGEVKKHLADKVPGASVFAGQDER